MSIWTIMRLSLRSLAANKLRTILAMLGIIISVWSVISALALGAGASASMMNRLSALGTNLLVARPAQRESGGVRSGSYQTLVVEDAQALLALDGVDAVAPVVRGSVQAKYFNRNTNTTVLGTSPTYLDIRAFTIDAGRGLTDRDIDASARVAVIGSEVAINLFGSAESWSVGQNITIAGVSYRVVGLLVSKGDQGWANPDDQIIIPYTTAMKQVLGMDYLSEIDIKATSQDDLESLQAKAGTLLRKNHRLQNEQANDFSLQNQAEMIETANNITLILSLLLGGIAGISLLVGGIGIMNIMLVTVAERTREIGIRKAIGAKQRDVLRQFLFESVTMSVIGGLAGLTLAVITAVALSAAQDSFTLVIEPYSIVLAIGFSLFVGVFFGYYPARRAARLDPIEALRYE